MPHKSIPFRQQFVRLCDCGCGQPTRVAISDYAASGIRRGEAQRYIRGHQSRKSHDDSERFAAMLDKSGCCWPYTGHKSHDGYGHFGIGSRTDGTRHLVNAHRFAYELAYGPIPEDMCVLHNCPDGDNPACCNPAHLWLGTRGENNTDRHQKGRSRNKQSGKLK